MQKFAEQVVEAITFVPVRVSAFLSNEIARKARARFSDVRRFDLAFSPPANPERLPRRERPKKFYYADNGRKGIELFYSIVSLSMHAV